MNQKRNSNEKIVYVGLCDEFMEDDMDLNLGAISESEEAILTHHRGYDSCDTILMVGILSKDKNGKLTFIAKE